MEVASNFFTGNKGSLPYTYRSSAGRADLRRFSLLLYVTIDKIYDLVYLTSLTHCRHNPAAATKTLVHCGIGRFDEVKSERGFFKQALFWIMVALQRGVAESLSAPQELFCSALKSGAAQAGCRKSVQLRSFFSCRELKRKSGTSLVAPTLLFRQALKSLCRRPTGG